ncbi:MAG: glycosyltransferase family 39 protein [Planctomycetes bacterium]|nr:glycosyltransferase family 39 protein [Planctomycetota bacterium]
MSIRQPQDVKNGRQRNAIVAVLLLLHAGLLAWGAWQHSSTWDEIAHLPAGISHWQLGRFDLFRVNPPLVRMVASLPVMAARPKTDWKSYDDRVENRPDSAVGRDFMQANGSRSFWLFTLARWACIPFSLLGGYVCYLWASELYGRSAGLLALALWCFSPNVLAHGQLITADMGATSMGVAAAYAFWRWLSKPNWGRAYVAGLVLGLAELAKLTWVVLYGLWPMLWIASVVLWPRCSGRQTLLSEAGQLGGIVLLSLFVLNSGYGFEGSFQRLGEYQFISRSLGGPVAEDQPGGVPAGRNRFAGSRLGDVPVPVPKNYLLGIDHQKWRGAETTQPAFLGGCWKMDGGWWYYYVYALAVKVPLGTWGLVLLAVFFRLTHGRDSATWRDELVLLAPIVVVFILFSSHTSLNKHLRYVLPIFPFALIWISQVARAVVLRQRTVTYLVGLALVWSFTSSLWGFPHSLSYFNELVGGPRCGPAHLHGSNVDWGQDLLYLKRWVDQHPEARPLGVAYIPPHIDPRLAGIEHTRIPCGPNRESVERRDLDKVGPKAGWHAISTRNVYDYSRKYACFLHIEPVAMAGYSIYIYHITSEEANRVRRELGLPELPESEHLAGDADGEDGDQQQSAGLSRVSGWLKERGRGKE